MKYVLKRIFRNKRRNLIMMSIIFVLSTLLFISQMMTRANNQLAQMIEDDTDLFFYISGVVNNYMGGYYPEDYSKMKEEYRTLFNDIKDLDGVEYANLQAHFKSDLGYSCDNIDQADAYTCLLFPTIPSNFYSISDVEKREEVLYGNLPTGLSSEQSLKRYEYLALDEIGKTNAEISYEIKNLYQFDLIGIDQSEFTELKNHSSTIVEGRNFSQDELNAVSYKAIVPNFSYFATSEGIKEVEIGDHFTYTFYAKDHSLSYDFEIIGLHDGFVDQYDSPYYQLIKNLDHYVYVPMITLEQIACDLETFKADNFNYIDDFTSAGELVAYDPFMINVADRNMMTSLLEELTPRLQELNKNSLDLPYTYVSSLDTYVDAITMSESNSTIFSILNFLLIILSLLTLVLLNIFNLNNAQKEIGILNALGAKKSKLQLALLLEFIIVSILPMTGAIIVSSIFSKNYAANEFSYQIMKILSGEYNVNFYDNSGQGVLVKKFMIDFGIKDYLFLILMWLSIALFAFVISYFKLKRLDPKNILLMGEKE